MNIKIGKKSFKITPYGNVQISNSIKKYGNGSAYFDGNGDYLKITDFENYKFGYNNEPFTIEFWVYRLTTDTQVFFAKHGGVQDWNGINEGLALELFATSSTIEFNFWGTSGLVTVVNNTSIPINEWVHLAVSYDGTTTSIFVNGIKQSITSSTNYGNTKAKFFQISGEVDNTFILNGYIDDFRLIRGGALYTSNFTPPSTELTKPESFDTLLLLNMNGADTTNIFINSAIGSMAISKNGSGKLNEKKYIDLLPPNFISKVTLSGGTYSNGTYTRSSGGTTTFDGPDGKTIQWQFNTWLAYDPLFNSGVDATFYSDNLIDWGEIDVGGAPTGVTENALSFLFDPVFYKSQIENERYKILLQGCSLPYVNGIYSLSLAVGLVNNRGYYIKDDDSSMVVNYEAGKWYIRDLAERDYSADLFYQIEGGGNSLIRPFQLDWSAPDGGTAYGDGQTPPTISEYLNLQYKYGGRLDPGFLEQIRNYQIDNTVPNEGVANNFNPSSPQHIVSAAFNTKKAEIKNNTFSYIKYSDNTDVEQKKLNRWYGSISNTQSNYSINPPKDSKYPLLKVRRNDSQPIFEVGPGKNSTLNMFIKLQRPLQHFRPGTSYLVREKRAIFCTSSDVGGSPFSIGYRSPYYNITGRPSYKSVFNNFSFVFSFGSVGYDATFGRPISRNLMTDYKFNFGEMYMLTIRSFDNYLAIYVNGELQEVAIVPFNPLVNPSYGDKPYQLTLSGGTYSNGTYQGDFGSTILNGPDGKYIELSSSLIDIGGFGGDLYAVDPAHPNFPDYVYASASEGIYWYDDGNVPNAGTPPNGVQDLTLQLKKLYKTRRDEMPLGPGFYKKDGTIYTNTDVESVFGSGNILSMFYLIFGKSSLAHGLRNNGIGKKKRRYLNNLDIGVISSYNAALSQSDISQIYENFRYRYI